jgi:sporulation protein YlmC with PRC-barrel domain
MNQRRFELMRDLLDREIVDADGTSCGMVDDIEFGYPKDKQPVVKALLVGTGAWADRLPALLAAICTAMFGRTIVRVPWEEVDQVTEIVKLKSKASTLQLGRIDRKVGSWLWRLPKS